MSGPIFSSPQQAITVTFHMVQRLAMLVSWCFVGLAHAALAVVLGLLLWWFQVTPEGVSSTLQTWSESKPFAVLSAAGLSAASLFAAYWWLVARLRRAAISGWLLDYLLQDSIEK